jgi:hypothetical protein
MNTENVQHIKTVEMKQKVDKDTQGVLVEGQRMVRSVDMM